MADSSDSQEARGNAHDRSKAVFFRQKPVDTLKQLPINIPPHQMYTRVASPGLDTAGIPRRIQS